MPLEDFLKELGVQKEMLLELRSKINKTTQDSNLLYNRIRNERINVASFLGDNIFRPDNRRRKHEALNEILSLRDISFNTERLITYLVKYEDELLAIGQYMKEWRKMILDFFPIIKAQIPVVPKFKKDWEVELILAIGEALVLKTFNSLKTMGFKKATAEMAIGLLLIIVSGILSGERRKEKFEKFRRDARTAHKSMNESIFIPLQKAKENMDKFFKDLGKSLLAKGLIDKKSAKYPDLIVKAVKEKTVEIRNLNMIYDDLAERMKKGNIRDLKRITDTVLNDTDKAVKEKEKIRYIIQVAYGMENKITSYELSLYSSLDLKTIKNIEVLRKLDNGQTAEQIALFSEVPKEIIEEMEQNLKQWQELRKMSA
ncbi:hypothetical protein [Aquimarina algiphila]|uniref:hypothetical protein n=1 Tax=Aquimarina algiphila TaxID=2047982 RepID=UPI0023308A70|nr:hypothetical protein [Aquimarina algiphila]